MPTSRRLSQHCGTAQASGGNHRGSIFRTLCEPITLVSGYRFVQGLADASRAMVTMNPKARDRRLRGLGPDPVGGVPPVSVTGARPTPALAAELGPTATPTTAAVLADFTYWIPEYHAETGGRGERPSPCS